MNLYLKMLFKYMFVPFVIVLQKITLMIIFFASSLGHEYDGYYLSEEDFPKCKQIVNELIIKNIIE